MLEGLAQILEREQDNGVRQASMFSLAIHQDTHAHPIIQLLYI